LSTVNLSSDVEDKLKIYRENFEKAYLNAAEEFYKQNAHQYLQENGVQNYMKYADQKLKEEESRASRYLETGYGCLSVSAVSGTCFLSFFLLFFSFPLKMKSY
jgi:cullin-5